MLKEEDGGRGERSELEFIRNIVFGDCIFM